MTPSKTRFAEEVQCNISKKRGCPDHLWENVSLSWYAVCLHSASVSYSKAICLLAEIVGLIKTSLFIAEPMLFQHALMKELLFLIACEFEMKLLLWFCSSTVCVYYRAVWCRGKSVSVILSLCVFFFIQIAHSFLKLCFLSNELNRVCSELQAPRGSLGVKSQEVFALRVMAACSTACRHVCILCFSYVTPPLTCYYLLFLHLSRTCWTATGPVYEKFLSRRTSWSLNIQSQTSWPFSRSEMAMPRGSAPSWGTGVYLSFWSLLERG